MRRERWMVSLILCLLLLSSCFTDYKLVNLNYPATSASNDSPRISGIKISLGDFQDERTIKDAIFEKYGTSKNAAPRWNMREAVTEFLKKALENELRISGIEIVTNTAGFDTEIPRLEGKVMIFYGWTTKEEKTLSAVVNIDISLFETSYKIYSDSFYSQKTGPKKFDEWQPVLLSATQDVMKTVAASIRQFLSREKGHE